MRAPRKIAIEAKEKAKLEGKSTYSTGYPCPHGHFSGRYVASSMCIDCCRIRHDIWAIDNREKVNAGARARRGENSAEEAIRGKKYRLSAQGKAVAEKSRVKNKEKRLLAERIRRAKDPSIRIRWQQKRRATKKQAIPTWYGEIDIFVVAEAARLACLRKIATGFAWHVDHIVPLVHSAVCGLHTASNIAVIPAAINTSKQNRYWPQQASKLDV